MFDLIVLFFSIFTVHSLSGAENRSWDGWVVTANASSVLCRPPLNGVLIKLRASKLVLQCCQIMKSHLCHFNQIPSKSNLDSSNRKISTLRGWESPRNFFATFEALLRRRYWLISSLKELKLVKLSLDVPFGSGCSSAEEQAPHPDEVEGLNLTELWALTFLSLVSS